MADSLSEAGQNLTTALGGFWQQLGNEPTFVPLDEHIGRKLLEQWEADADSIHSQDMVLEFATEGGET